MTTSKSSLQPLTAYVPINLSSLDTLLINTRFHRDRIYAIYHQIYMCRLQQSTNESIRETSDFKQRWVPLHSKILEKVATNRYSNYIQFMEENNLLEIKRDSISGKTSYTSGELCIRYRIPSHLYYNNDSFRNYKKVTITDHRTLRALYSLKNYFTPDPLQPILPVDDKLTEMLKTLRCDSDSAESFIQRWKQKELKNPDGRPANYFSELMLSVDAINDGSNSITMRDKFGGRFHSLATRYKRELRPYLYFTGYENKEIGCLDVVGCMPYLASQVLNPNILMQLVPEYLPCISDLGTLVGKTDFKLYAHLCSEGKIYEYWMAAMGISRDAAKGQLINVILFAPSHRSHNHKQNQNLRSVIKIRESFRIHFPSVLEAFDKIKNAGEDKLPFITEIYLDRNNLYEPGTLHRNMSAILQRAESRIFGRIASELVENEQTPFFLIHDSIVTLEQNMIKAEEIMLGEFGKLGMKPPKIKSEVLKKIIIT